MDLEPKEGAPVQKTISSPEGKIIDLLKPFSEVEKPVKLNSITVVIVKKYDFCFITYNCEQAECQAINDLNIDLLQLTGFDYVV